jgi:hypothetical protein
MANRYPGYCIDCGREVRANHGELIKRGGKYMVSCGKGKAASAAATPASKPKLERPTGNRLGALAVGSSNAALCAEFSVDGLGIAQSFAPYEIARAIKYVRWDNQPLKWAPKPEDVGKSLRELHPEEAAAHDLQCEANEALYGHLHAAGQLSSDEKSEFRFLLSEEEQAAIVKLISDRKAAMFSAILDGSAEIRVGEVGCDYPHPQILEITVAGEKQEYALIQTLLADYSLRVDGSAACEDLAGALRKRMDAKLKQEAALAAHRARRAAGHHIVILRRCWECGRTQILGELDDNMNTVRMAPDVYAACRREQQEAHQRSIASAEGRVLSSVGFEPDPESKFEFQIDGEDYYCGC